MIFPFVEPKRPRDAMKDEEKPLFGFPKQEPPLEESFVFPPDQFGVFRAKNPTKKADKAIS